MNWLRPFSSNSERQLLRMRRFAALLTLSLSLLLIHQQVVSLSQHQAPAAGSRAARSSYFWISCPNDPPNIQHLITPLPDSRYYYSERFGWLDSGHFDAGNPAKLIDDVTTAVARGGDTITITQSVRDGLTGHTATYRVSSYLRQEQAMAAALGIYLDWSYRFEAWQGNPPRGLFGPLTSFSIEDLPTQYLGFVEDAQQIDRAVLLTCYLGDMQTADAPPHLWFSEPENNDLLPEVERLTNKTFDPLVQTEAGWQHIAWPESLQMIPVRSSSSTWMFLGEETWYLSEE